MMNKEEYNINFSMQTGIYIHIPFCVKKCDYCDFLSGPSDKETIDSYVKALLKEIDLTKTDPTKKDFVVSSIFFGGGTPSILESKYIKEIMNSIKASFQIESDAEISIECNPGTVTLEKLLEYREAGINRLSFGLQSTNNSELKAIGRIHTFEQFQESFEMARSAGFDNINVDLISALPNQTIATWKNTLRKILEFCPEHISAYGLILEEGTILYDRIEEQRKQGIDPIPCEDLEREMYYFTNEILQKEGYTQYEISNYAKPGYQSRHNLKYWSLENYIGFGLGAASYVNGVRYKNIEDINEYTLYLNENEYENENKIIEVESISLSKIRIEVEILTKARKIEEFMFLGLRKISGISINEFYKRFDMDYDFVYGKLTKKLIEIGVLVRTQDRIHLSTRGLDICNSVMSEFLLDENIMIESLGSGD